MSKHQAEKILGTLGVPHGTALVHLRRKIIYNLLPDQICYRCKQPIESDEDLSIDHIEPWEDRENGKELFWDLDNIAFSHKRCNKQHKTRLIESPKGQSWCCQCKQHKLVDDFYKGNRTNGLRKNCKQCCSDNYQRSKINGNWASSQ